MGVVLHFSDLGEIAYHPDNSIDAEASPLVSVLLPKERRGAIWTIGEVRFLANQLRRRFPALHRISTQFSKWISGFECVFANGVSREAVNTFDYYLEGSVRNSDEPVWALNSGMEALRAQRYFVSERDNDIVLEKLCRTLQLRGVSCSVQ
ncbi:hypothetical protein ACQ858_22150 [Variovorax ureilyticus]|uniref:hypothetical protein n=1 Tax=Variovorax ureilyticus TaxID=1836198 RepID=UPI003D66720C